MSEREFVAAPQLPELIHVLSCEHWQSSTALEAGYVELYPNKGGSVAVKLAKEWVEREAEGLKHPPPVTRFFVCGSPAPSMDICLQIAIQAHYWPVAWPIGGEDLRLTLDVIAKTDGKSLCGVQGLAHLTMQTLVTFGHNQIQFTNSVYLQAVRNLVIFLVLSGAPRGPEDFDRHMARYLQMESMVAFHR